LEMVKAPTLEDVSESRDTFHAPRNVFSNGRYRIVQTRPGTYVVEECTDHDAMQQQIWSYLGEIEAGGGSIKIVAEQIGPVAKALAEFVVFHIESYP
jgi:hypothetical protein